MVMTLKRRDQSSIFAGPKSTCAIPAKHPLLRDALIQASFDESITSIDFMHCACIAGRCVVLDAVIVTKYGRRYELDVVAARPLNDIDNEGLRLIALEQLDISPIKLGEADIRAEPRCTTAREIWKHRLTKVPFRQSMAITDAIDECGPLTITEVEDRHSGSMATLNVIFSLVATGLLTIDINRPVGPTTVVRRSTGSRRSPSTTRPNVVELEPTAGAFR
jgi:hypothetical protein